MPPVRRLELQFCAFIPGSLGKPLREYFLNDFRNTARVMQNHAQFNAALNRVSGTWIREPMIGYIPQPAGVGYFGRYFATDNREFGGGSSRVKSVATIDLAQVGGMSPNRTVFRHSCDDSHLIQTSVVDVNAGASVGPMGPVIPSRPQILGSVGAPSSRRSSTAQNVDQINNDVFGTYFTVPGTPRSSLIDGTRIRTRASAGYPFLEPFSPNIDYRLTIILHKVGNTINVRVSGRHDSFPFYELIANGAVKYRYNARDHGHTGPNPLNLNRMREFSVDWGERI